jgi:uncharacterized protein DUF5317
LDLLAWWWDASRIVAQTPELERLDDRPSGGARGPADACRVLMLVVIALCLLTVPLTGGRLTRLADLRLRLPGLAVAGIAVQMLIVSVLPGEALAGLHAPLHVLSYALLGGFGWANRRVTGVPVVLAGGALNAVAILANGGVMPTDPAVAAAAANHAAPGEFINSTAIDDARLAFLGDVLATPDSLPLQNVYSVGDLIIVLGLVVVVHAACHVQKAASSRASPTGSS